MNFIEVCRKIIALETTPQQGNRECAEFVAGYARDLGFATELQNDTLGDIEQSNVLIRPGPRPKEEMLFQTHLDTVEAGTFAHWTKTQSNPFNVSIYGDTLYGLGVAETKLDLLCKITAAKDFLNTKLRLPFVIAGTYGAQSGMAGALRLVRKKMISAKAALVGEPTDLKLAVAGHGLAVVEVAVPFSPQEMQYRKEHDLLESTTTQSKLFHGRSAHSSQPSLGNNAIVKMLDHLIQLPLGIAVMDMDGGISHNSVPASSFLEIDVVSGLTDSVVPKLAVILKAMRDVELEFLGYPQPATLNIGKIRTFDEQIVVVGSCRIPPTIAAPIYEAWMEKLKRACESQGATFCVKELKPPFSTSVESKLVCGCQAVLAEMELPQQPAHLSSTTEASVLSRLGIECLAFGPGQSVGNSHEPNERVSIGQLYKATEFYRKVIERFCL